MLFFSQMRPIKTATTTIIRVMIFFISYYLRSNHHLDPQLESIAGVVSQIDRAINGANPGRTVSVRIEDHLNISPFTGFDNFIGWPNRAAMTGHQVYSTLHTNSAIGAIPRLLDIGILPDIMAGNIIGIVAQRLIRVLCNECKYPYSPDAMERKLLGVSAQQDLTLYRAAGCDACHHQGYNGRMAIMELLKMDHDLDDLVSHRASTRQIREAALEKGFRPLAMDGVRRIQQGITSLAEVSRVVDLTDRLG